nr:hypothetical protein HmN_000348600 [Hymenolepis microstoma]
MRMDNWNSPESWKRIRATIKVRRLLTLLSSHPPSLSQHCEIDPVRTGKCNGVSEATVPRRKQYNERCDLVGLIQPSFEEIYCVRVWEHLGHQNSSFIETAT